MELSTIIERRQLATIGLKAIGEEKYREIDLLYRDLSDVVCDRFRLWYFAEDSSQ